MPPSYASGVQFRALMTPDPLLHAASHQPNPPEFLTPSPIASSSNTLQNDSFQPILTPDLFTHHPDVDLDELSTHPDSLPFRRRRTTNAYTKIHNLLAELRQDRISPIDILIQVLDPEDISYDRYRGNLYKEDSTKLALLLDKIMEDYNGKQKLLECMRSHLFQFACDTVAEEMKTRRAGSILPGIQVVTPSFIEEWSLDEEIDTTPFLTRILETAAQTERAKLHNKKKKPQKMCKVVTRQLLYQSSNRCLAFQAEFGLFLWATGCARQTIDALFRCGLSVCYDGVLNVVESLADHCMLQSIDTANDPHSFNYDNVNISTSIFVEQRGSAGPAKVQSGTFGILYKLRGAIPEHMLIAPIMRRFRASKGLEFNRDIKPSLNHLSSFHDQLVVTVIHALITHNEGFEDVAKHPQLQHTARRAIPVGYKTEGFPLRATTIPEATVRDNLLYHDEVYLNQLRRTPESLSKYAIPGFHDQLTNARIRSAQILRAKDVDAWSRREIFQLGFGLFHLCLNLVGPFYTSIAAA
ncbi:hypothetical protein FB451DRAFT_1479113 [Mycena latifolia]|nr:hypothetical protein FB451DRAFT_1479113 [Mycena latifolia]